MIRESEFWWMVGILEGEGYFGLSVELGYAYALGKKIVFCDEIRSDWRSPYFGMHREMATEVVHSLEAAATVIKGN